ncbi:hypothetical protein APA_71 [Pseudanabaena sp. lw0831]|uniref:hypothetical protein n=1 Tax=Pseudanabaena sp. lw0831 TaxID=1357935 RepID=UPI001A323A26|nr:hypothetical protein [Pseudanabaena sp. lw0831]GBO52402.1 hypothetical protein APA_71 [Pseudanabaena sp. lw0831]
MSRCLGKHHDSSDRTSQSLNGVLKLEMTLFVSDTLTSPLLPEFACPLVQIFE